MTRVLPRGVQLIALAALALVLAASAAAPTLARPQAARQTGAAAPVDPAYLRALVRLPQTILAPALGGKGLGQRPGPQRALTATSAGTVASGRTSAARQPASFDLRSRRRVSPVKDQGPFGTCWAFASCGSLESGLLPRALADFSEDNMVLTSGFDVGANLYNAGGNPWMAAAYVTRWGGPVNESEDAYADGLTPAGLSARAHVQDVVMVPRRASATDNAAIKEAVIRYGAAYASMGWYGSSSGSAYYNPATAGYYYDGSSGTNHGVLIVGWDDRYAAANFATTPPGPGAFLVKNSWGTTWGQSGYFWLSYHDAKFGRTREMFIFNGSETTTNYDAVYQYDPLGDCNEYGFGGATGWLANVFTAETDGALSAVGFWALAPNTSYQVFSGATLATLRPAARGTLPMGYHTARLPSPTRLSAGAQFVVAVKVTTPGATYPIAFEAPYSGYSSAATAQAGQSYVSPDGRTWTDFTTVVADGNVCLKAYVKTRTGRQ